MSAGASVKPPTLASGSPQRVRRQGEGASGRPIVIDLFCGLGGWSDGFLAEGYQCIGFDLERHDYGTGGYFGELVLQDVLTLHGRQFKHAACIVASPPCQEFSYMAMPWKRAKQIARALRGKGGMPVGCDVCGFPVGYTGSRTITELTALFDACFRIQAEASKAAGHHIPMVVENVKGAQPWAGRANASFGSFYLWGDVRSVGGRIVAAHRVEFGAPGVKAMRGAKVSGLVNGRFPGGGLAQGHLDQVSGRKVDVRYASHGSWKSAEGEDWRSPQNVGRKVPKPDGYQRSQEEKRQHIGHARKAASAQIAKIPFALSEYIARSFRPEENE